MRKAVLLSAASFITFCGMIWSTHTAYAGDEPQHSHGHHAHDKTDTHHTDADASVSISTSSDSNTANITVQATGDKPQFFADINHIVTQFEQAISQYQDVHAPTQHASTSSKTAHGKRSDKHRGIPIPTLTNTMTSTTGAVTGQANNTASSTANTTNEVNSGKQTDNAANQSAHSMTHRTANGTASSTYTKGTKRPPFPLNSTHTHLGKGSFDGVHPAGSSTDSVYGGADDARVSAALAAYQKITIKDAAAKSTLINAVHAYVGELRTITTAAGHSNLLTSHRQEATDALAHLQKALSDQSQNNQLMLKLQAAAGKRNPNALVPLLNKMTAMEHDKVSNLTQASATLNTATTDMKSQLSAG